jgi:hypothetical protein
MSLRLLEPYGIFLPQVCHVKENGHWTSGRRLLMSYGRDAEIRTRDLTHPKRARYQAAPRPVCLP